MTSRNLFTSLVVEGMVLHPGYPASIQVPHALAAACSFRRSYGAGTWEKVSLLHRVM